MSELSSNDKPLKVGTAKCMLKGSATVTRAKICLNTIYEASKSGAFKESFEIDSEGRTWVTLEVMPLWERAKTDRITHDAYLGPLQPGEGGKGFRRKF